MLTKVDKLSLLSVDEYGKLFTMFCAANDALFKASVLEFSSVFTIFLESPFISLPILLHFQNVLEELHSKNSVVIEELNKAHEIGD